MVLVEWFILQDTLWLLVLILLLLEMVELLNGLEIQEMIVL